MQTLTRRSDIAREHTWNLENIFPTNDDWERDYKAIAERLPEVEALKGTLAQSAQTFLTVLQKRDELSEKIESLFVYASMRKDEDTTNSTYQGMFDRAMQLYIRASTAFSYIVPEILALPQEKLDQFLRDVPELELYKQQLADLNRQRPHVRALGGVVPTAQGARAAVQR